MQIQFVLLLFSISFVFFFMMLWSKEDWNQIIFGLIAMIMFFVTGGSASVIHKPYVVVTENTVENAMTVVNKGVQTVNKNWPLTVVCWALALFCLAMVFIKAVPMLKDWLSKRGGGYG